MASEAFFADPASSHARVLEFLGLPATPLRTYETHNPRTYKPMDAGLEAHLREYFAEPNARLTRLLGEDFGWPAPVSVGPSSDHGRPPEPGQVFEGD